MILVNSNFLGDSTGFAVSETEDHAPLLELPMEERVKIFDLMGRFVPAPSVRNQHET